MTKEKKLLIITIILAALVPICIFGLSFITEAFLVVGFFSGISALLCGNILLDLKSGKNPKLILIGIVMMIFGFAYLGASDFFPWLSIPLSAIFAVAGLIVFLKGIKDWRDMRHNRAPKGTKQMNKKIYIGIGLLVGGYIAAFVLFNIYPLLMCIGIIVVLVGFVVLGCGITERRNAKSSSYQGTSSFYANTRTATQVKTEYCVRCGKNLSYLAANQVFVMDGSKYCAACRTAIEQEEKNQHTICSVCGIDLPMENMHVIDNARLCHKCFLKTYGNIDSYDEDTTSRIDDAVKILRNKILTEITKNPAINYQLASLLWQDAASCFPKSGFQWDGAWFKLDLKTGKLFAEVSTYPNQFGANYEDTISLTSSEFNRIAKKYNMNQELQAFQTDVDWAKLFDDNLKAVVSGVCAQLQKQEEERKNEERKQYAIAEFQRKKKVQAQRLVNVLVQIQKRKTEEILSGICSICKRPFAGDKLIFIDGDYYCEDCYSFTYNRSRKENPYFKDELQQISYEIGGVINQSLFSCVVNVADRLLAGGFEFYRASVGGGVNKISNSGVMAYDASYTDYNIFKNNMESDFPKREQEEYKNSGGWISSLDYSYICAFLARNNLKVYVLAECGHIILRWFDTSDKAFATTRVFTENVIEEVYDNKCTIKQIDNLELNEEFLSNWQ